MLDMEIPEFLKNYDEDDIHDEILELIPDEYDKSEGPHYYNFTRPFSRILSEERGFILPEAIKLIWPQFSTGEYLDLHAEKCNITRKSAQKAVGEITFTGTEGTVIPAGYTVSTESRNDTVSKDYATDEECVIGEDGTVTVKASAVVAGADGNTAANTIVVNTSSFDDITSVNNSAPFKFGYEEEDDDSLYDRVHEYNITQGDRGTGNPSDYKRWALEVEGTGSAKVIRAKDTSGLVTIILTDANGDPADEELCEKVYDHIMSPDDEDARIAPCGAFLSVIPPETQEIIIVATVELKSSTIETVKETFLESLKAYFQEAITNKEVLYHRVCNALGDIEGVYDFRNLTINGGTVNIQLGDGVYPYIESAGITLTLAEE